MCALVTGVQTCALPISITRTARYGLPLMLAIIGGEPARFAPLVELYHRAPEHYGQAPQPVGFHSPGYVADTDEQALAEMWPHYRDMHARLSRARDWGPPTRPQYAMTPGPQVAPFAGSPRP